MVGFNNMCEHARLTAHIAYCNSPTQEYDNRVALSRDESQHEDILATTVVALGHCFSQRGLGV